MSVPKTSFELTPPLRATDVLTCDACGRQVTQRGYRSHRKGRACESVVVQREMDQRGWVRARACSKKLREAGCPLEWHVAAVGDGTHFRGVWWAPRWAVDEYREGEPAIDMMKRLAPLYECVAAELAVRMLAGGRR